MTEQEKFNAEVQAKLTVQDEKFNTLIRELHDFKEEMRDFKTEMRQQNQMRAEELRELRQRQDAMQAQHNADMKELREDIKGALRHIQGLTIASMVGIGAIAIATWVFVLTDARNEMPPAQSAQVEMKSADVADK